MLRGDGGGGIHFLIVLLCSLGTIAREEWKRWVKPEELESISVKICYLAFLGFGM